MTAGGGPTSGNEGAYPVAIVGAGPVGLAAAAHLVARGERPIVFESARRSPHTWPHGSRADLSPWRYNVDAVAAKLLRASGWVEPDPDVLPTGRSFVVHSLSPGGSPPKSRAHLRLAPVGSTSGSGSTQPLARSSFAATASTL